MSNRFRLAAVVGGALIALTLPVAAQASTKVVYMGEPPSTANNFEQKYSSDVNDFFPHGITVHAGDSVKFIPGFHTVDFPPRGGKSLPFVVANGPQASGVNDAAGQPFWFNGKVNKLGLNPLLLKPATKATYNGTKRVDSGLNAGPQAPKPFVVKFPKTGSFTYYCDVHPGMKGVVKVVAKSAKVPSAKADKTAIQHQVASDLVVAARLGKTVAPTATVLVGGAGAGHVEYYGFHGPQAPISAGTTLRFQMGKGSLEVHTATTDSAASSAPPAGPPNFDIPSPYLLPLSQTFQGAGPFDPIATYPSEAPGGSAASLSSSLHGNGFWNSGALDNSASSPLPSNASVRFDTPGTYHFYCLIHTFMELTVTVQ